MIPDKVLVWTRPSDGQTLITQPHPAFPMLPGEGEAEYFDRLEAHVRAKLEGAADDWVRVRVADLSEVPPDGHPLRYFREAWLPNFSVDMAKARAIHEARLVSRGEVTANDKLRIDAATTPEELRSIELQVEAMRD